MANLITVGRIILLFITIGIIYILTPVAVLIGLLLTIVVFASDALDGYVARRRGSASEFGAVFDIAGDRIVENVYWVVLAHLGLVPIWMPLVTIVRSFVVDGLRSMALAQGKTAFGEKTMMTSRFGTWLAASRFNRAVYGVVKVVAFCWMLLILALRLAAAQGGNWATFYHDWGGLIDSIGTFLIYFTVLYMLMRGAVVVWDSRPMFLPGPDSLAKRITAPPVDGVVSEQSQATGER
jgi:CDP-diacylglycerol---glycerol-3-phosphate 3-phosphatidyltransferase